MVFIAPNLSVTKSSNSRFVQKAPRNSLRLPSTSTYLFHTLSSCSIVLLAILETGLDQKSLDILLLLLLLFRSLSTSPYIYPSIVGSTSKSSTSNLSCTGNGIVVGSILAQGQLLVNLTISSMLCFGNGIVVGSILAQGQLLVNLTISS